MENGFNAGKTKIINSLINGIDKTLNGELRALYFKQAGGKYCFFECPLCGAEGQSFKYTQKTGECASCGNIVKLMGAEYETEKEQIFLISSEL